MKVAVCLASFLALSAVSASHVPTGASSQYRSQNNLGQYSFGFDESGLTGGSFRHEKSDIPGTVTGSYGLRGADGKMRVVNYIADAAGFRADVKTNELAEPRDSAGVAVNHPVPVALAAPVPLPVPVAAAPVALAGPAPLPLPVAAPAHAPLALPAAYGLPPLAPPPAFGYNVVAHHFAPLGY